MRGAPLFAWRYLAHHPVRSLALVVGVALTLFLPLAVGGLVARYEASLRARADSTPLVLGAPGSRYDLVLGALHFRGRAAEPITKADARALGADGLAVGVPLFLGRHGELAAGGWPLVGVGHEYYAFRGLVPARGALPLHLGECALGARAALELGLGPGDGLLTDPSGLYDLAGAYPLRMRVAGVLLATGTPDDGAVFCDVRTAWIAAGIGHGHAAAETQDEGKVLRRDADGRVVLSAALVEYQEITPESARDFHFHGDDADLPLSAAIVLPRDAKARTLLKGRYRARADLQLVEPAVVMGELLELVFRAKAFFDAQSTLSVAAALVFLGVIVTLSLAVRARERRTLAKLGTARGTVARLCLWELAYVLLAGAAVAGLGAWAFVALAGRWLLVG